MVQFAPSEQAISPINVSRLVKPFEPISRPRILFACPNTPRWKKTAQSLELLGIDVDYISSGKQCVHRALSSPELYHTIIASLDLGDLDGFSVISLLRENNCRLPAVTMAGSDHYSFEELSFHVGSNGHFSIDDIGELSCFITSVAQLNSKINLAA